MNDHRSGPSPLNARRIDVRMDDEQSRLAAKL
jgi:hypothetical protein